MFNKHPVEKPKQKHSTRLVLIVLIKMKKNDMNNDGMMMMIQIRFYF